MEHTVTWPGWETVRLIGRGSFGAVYEIQRSLFGEVEKAALKVITIPQNASDIEELRSDGFDEESITDTFKNHLKSIVSEYSLMRKMNGSANIVNCDDVRYVQHEDGIGWDIYIKMELLTPLTKALPDAIPEEIVIKIATDLCAALELCERFDIVHRDIKPQNIFVSDIGDYKLGDFGIAKTVEKTMGGTKIGTYKYMAPEVYNNQPYGSAADIYSLGLVLYWMLNERRMPFLPLPPAKLSAGMDEEARNRRLSGEPLPAPKNGSDALKHFVLKACAYEPKERYTNARQMREALNHLSVSSEEPEEEGTTAAPKPIAEKKVAVVPIREEVAESEATIVSPVQKTAPERKAKNNPHAAPKKRTGPMIAAACVLIGLLVGGSAFFLGRSTRQAEIAVAPSTGATTEMTTEAATVETTEAVTEPAAMAATEMTTEAATEATTEVTMEAPTEDEVARLDAAYAAAEQLLQAGKCDQAISAFESLGEYSDSADRVLEARYAQASRWLASGNYDKAIVAFEALNGYQDSAAQIEIARQQAQYAGAEALAQSGKTAEAAIAFYKMGEKQRSFALWDKAAVREIIYTSGYHSVGLKSDGTAVATGYNDYGQCDVSSWKDIVSVSAGSNYTVGLKEDGTVVSVGNNVLGQFDVSRWKDIVAISAGKYHTVGLKADGTVVATGWNRYGQCDVSNWTGIVAISAGGCHTVGLKADGTAVSVGYNEGDLCDVSGWKDIVAVSSGHYHTVGLKTDGTVVATGWNDFGQCNVSSWKDIIAISAGYYHTVGLKSDGTVVAVGDNEYSQCDVSSWKGTLALSAGSANTLGLKSDSSVVAAGSNSCGQCNVSTWNNIKLPSN